MTAHPFAPVTIDGYTARYHSPDLVSIHRGEQWLGNAELVDGLRLQLLSLIPDMDAVALYALSGAVVASPLAEWVISCPDWAGVHGFADRESAAVEYDRLAAHAVEFGGKYALLHNGIKVTSISKRVD